MNRLTLLTPLSVVLLTLSGCVTHTTPTATPTAATTSYASELGDQNFLSLDEIVVSLPLRGTNQAYHNLHLSLAVVINPVTESVSRNDPVSSSSKSYSYEVEGLVRRLGPRINATVSGALTNGGGQHHDIAQTNVIRKEAVSTAEAVLTEALRNWKYAADYKIEVIVLNSYWTDASVGRLHSGSAPRW